jgi:hypothetical protein
MVDRMSGQRDLAWLWETLRTSPEPLTRKRIKRLAAQLSAAAVCESLGLPDTPEVLRLAQTELLRRRGYPVFQSFAEAQAHPARQFWPGAKPRKSKTGREGPPDC